jgi:hypothetical protein
MAAPDLFVDRWIINFAGHRPYKVRSFGGIVNSPICLS